MSRVLVIGGYGGFGARLSRRLLANGHKVLVGGRSLERARAFCAGEAGAEPVQLDRTCDLSPVLRDCAPDIVIDAAGPFQTSSFAVPEACIATGIHYIDLADARAFVCDVEQLDALAQRAGVAVISGASSVPALSGAIARHLARGVDRVSQVDIAISASSRATASRSVAQAILSYAGRPIYVFRGGRWTAAFGGGERRRETFVVGDKTLGGRSIALCDVPDLALLPQILPGSPSVMFRAGSDRALHAFGFSALGWLVRRGLLKNPERGAAPLARLQRLTGKADSSLSGMSVVIRGWKGGERIERRWTMIAEHGSGPEIPTLAAALLVERIAVGRVAPGARDASQELDAAEFFTLLERMPIAHEIVERPLGPSLYHRVLGQQFNALPAPIRDMHCVNADAGAMGEGTVVNGSSIGARLLCRMMGFPPSGTYPVHVHFAERDGAEVWTRDFGDHRFRSVLAAKGAQLGERFGPITFLFDLPADRSGLAMILRGWRLCGVPLPRFLAPTVVARETDADGRFNFDVAVSMPLIGKVIEYRGWLERAGA